MTVRSSTQQTGSEHVEYEEKPLRILPVDWDSLDRIRPHESVNEPDLRAFCSSLRDKGWFYKPILIDGDSGVILDGTHRWAGLREMGATEAPVIPFRYRDDDEITVSTWYPFTDRPVSELLQVLDDLDCTRERQSPRSPDDYSDDVVVMMSADDHYLIDANAVDLFHSLEESLDFQYTKNRHQLARRAENGNIGFLRPAPDKEEVVRIALDGESVPPKYTCHEFPYKYPHIMVPTKDLVTDE